MEADPKHRGVGVPSTVVEIILDDGADFEAARKWGAGSIRGGDGMIGEHSRLFIVLPVTGLEQVQAFLARMAPGSGLQRVRLEVHAFGEDELVDSIYRRAQGGIFPVQPRRE